jgi:hypothetical protein
MARSRRRGAAIEHEDHAGVVKHPVTAFRPPPVTVPEMKPSKTAAFADLVDRARSNPHGRASTNPFRWFTPALALLLFGYLFFSRPFAHIHVPGTPVFIGEIVLAIGIVEAIALRAPWLSITARSPILKVLFGFMAVCLLRLVIDLPHYRVDAIRDSSIWYYGAYAFLVTAAVIYDPTFTLRMLRWYRRVAPWFFVWTPFAIVLSQLGALSSVTIPDSATPVNAFRTGDYAVHVAIAIAFPWLGINRMAGLPPRPRAELALGVMAMTALLIAGSQNRGGLAAAMLLMAIVMFYLPTGRRRRIVLPVAASLLLVIATVVILDLRIPGQRRDVSVQQVALNVTSVVASDDQELSGTVDWRQKLWTQVIDDLTSSRAWLTGLGFGPILPERYDIELPQDDSEPLRNVHNSHLTIMARVGFPGFAIWVLLWTVWTVHLVRFIRRRPGRLKDPSAALAAWLIGASAAFMVNAFFDPALEGPHGAIWLFALVGLGSAHTMYQRPRRPSHDVLHTSSGTP